ncbi:hypothetical protein EOA13_25865 [Mesorhizobium sp. M7A.F.Ca.US.011.01.1.1]|uniref:hypothetical protein n=1 Tax=Mesorhizobium sp. M7A.F.Ca.US.011.01.1.1 TaxID=2496741 RepID=UPI000FCA1DEF|nr:hypothetical protein [Mesorhizobium sp. M7A.F.Ca.US.011.01.1.1]RUX25832.1 hypothetical protein EOA13_25865 [Mesorhizobium sp. M7A.F.Ca.US.011.01.1.1]
MKSASDTGDGSYLPETAPAVAPEKLRKAMLEFVEALAVADARRDHLIATGSPVDRTSVIDSENVQKAPKI